MKDDETLIKVHISIREDQVRDIEELHKEGIFTSLSQGIRECIDYGLPEIKEKDIKCFVKKNITLNTPGNEK